MNFGKKVRRKLTPLLVREYKRNRESIEDEAFVDKKARRQMGDGRPLGEADEWGVYEREKVIDG
jgi:hypothetical protein